MAQFELKPGQSVQTVRRMTKCTVSSGGVPIRVELVAEVAPADPSASAQVWSEHGGLWRGTFGRPLAQLPARAKLVALPLTGEFAPGVRLSANLDTGEDQIAIEARDVGGLPEAVIATLHFTEGSLSLTGADESTTGPIPIVGGAFDEPRRDGGSRVLGGVGGGGIATGTPAAAAARSALTGHTAAPGTSSLLVVIDGSASMTTASRREHLRTLVECLQAAAGQLWSGDVRLVGLANDGRQHETLDAFFAEADNSPIMFGSTVDDGTALRAAIRPREAVVLVTDDLPVWTAQPVPDVPLHGLVLVGYPGPVPEEVAGLPVTAWAVRSTESKDALALPMAQLVRGLAQTTVAEQVP